MKKIGFFVCLGLMFAALSCTKDILDPSSGKEGSVVLTVRAVTEQTRATDTLFEGNIESLQVFLFANGKLESEGYSESGDVTLRTYPGSKEIWAVANHSEIGWTKNMTVSDLKNTVVLLEDEMWNVMVGSVAMFNGVAPTPLSTTTSTITIPVTRIAARFVLREVMNNTVILDDNVVSQVGESVVTVHRAYITNVVGDANLSATSSNYSYKPKVWYNKMVYDERDLPSILYCEEAEVQIELNSGVNLDWCFYCYPNPTEGDIVGLPWDSRFTRLVVEAEFGGKQWYYVVKPEYGIKSNQSYEIVLYIEGPGSISPEGTIYSGDEDDVDDWDDVGDGDDDEDEDEDEDRGDGGFGRLDPDPNDTLVGPSSVGRKCDGWAVIPFKGGYAQIREYGL